MICCDICQNSLVRAVSCCDHPAFNFCFACYMAREQQTGFGCPKCEEEGYDALAQKTLSALL